MNTYRRPPAAPGARTDPLLAGQQVVLPDNGSGRIETTILQGGKEVAAVRLDDGRELMVPVDVLEWRKDGAWHLPDHFAGLPSGRQTTGQNKELVIPVAQEELVVGKRQVETGRVRITKQVKTREEVVDEPLCRQEVEVVHVPVNQVVAEAPQPRQEGDTMIIPVFEEVLVVEKRLVLKEELHIRQSRIETHRPERVVLRSEEVKVERFTRSEATEQDKGGSHEHETDPPAQSGPE